MLSSKIIFLLLMTTLVFIDQSNAWRRRRRRRCPYRDCKVSSWSYWSDCSAYQCIEHGSRSRTRTIVTSPSCGGSSCPELYETRECYGTAPVDCEVTYWSYWSSCSVYQCGHHGPQSRSRSIETSPSCGGSSCPELYETRQCHGTKPVDCQLSSWSEWSACTTPCGVSGTQSKSRHKIRTEQCGGTCMSNFRITRACLHLSCLNGGTLNYGSCSCKEDYSGVCCEKAADKHLLEKVLLPCVLVPIGFTIVYFVIRKLMKGNSASP